MFGKTYAAAAVVLGALLLGGCGKDDGGSINCRDGGTFCVGLVTDVGGIDDKAFNQSAWDGVLQAQQVLDAQVRYIESADASEYDAHLAAFGDAGYDVILSVGYGLLTATQNAVPAYPQSDFVGIDQSNGGAAANYTGLLYHEDRAGFLAGALAAMMSSSGTVGAVLATDQVPTIVLFKEGFEAGAKYIDPNATVLTVYYPGGLDTAFTDPDWGAARAAEMIGSGADVIFGVGGTTGNGAIIETAKHAGAYCIGVDSDQWETLPETHACLISSAMKRIDAGVFDLIKAAKEGTFPGGNYYGEVGMAPYHDFDSVIPQAVKDKMAQLEANLTAETLSTGVTP